MWILSQRDQLESLGNMIYSDIHMTCKWAMRVHGFLDCCRILWHLYFRMSTTWCALKFCLLTHCWNDVLSCPIPSFTMWYFLANLYSHTWRVSRKTKFVDDIMWKKLKGPYIILWWISDDDKFLFKSRQCVTFNCLITHCVPFIYHSIKNTS